MIESSAKWQVWRAFEAEFRTIVDPFGELRADWNLTSGWRFVRVTARAALEFEEIASRVARILDYEEPLGPQDFKEASELLVRWFESLRLGVRGCFEFGQVPSADATHMVRLNQIGSINHVVEASAQNCRRLALEDLVAIEARRSSPIRVETPFQRAMHPTDPGDLHTRISHFEVPTLIEVPTAAVDITVRSFKVDSVKVCGYRKRCGMTQSEFAEKCDCSTDTIQRAESKPGWRWDEKTFVSVAQVFTVLLKENISPEHLKKPHE